jgi:hypothetical protein
MQALFNIFPTHLRDLFHAEGLAVPQKCFTGARKQFLRDESLLDLVEML